MSEQNLHQQLLELEYDLLSAEEAAALRNRIETEPEVARAYEEARRTARAFASAARQEVPQIQLARPAETLHAEHARTVVTSSKSTAARRRTVAWIGAIAAALLVMVTLGGYLWQRATLRDLAADHLRLVVTGPAKLEAGVPSQYSITTTSITGEPLPVKVEYAVYTLPGKSLLHEQARTDDAGRLNVTIPRGLPISGAARFEVLAYHRDSSQRMQTYVPAETRRFVTQLALDKPLYQPGEAVFYRSLTLGRFGLDVPQEMPVHFEIHDPSGATVPGSELEGVTQRGVGSGAFVLPAEIAGGEYTLVARGLDGSFPEEKRKFFVRRYRLPRLKKDLEFVKDSYTPGDKVAADFSVNRAEGGPAAEAALRIAATVDGTTVHEVTPKASANGTYHVEFTLPKEIEKGDAQLSVVVDDGGTIETIAKTIPINLGKVEVKFYPEGGDLVAGVENRVYFTARDPLGKPVHIEGNLLDNKGKTLAKLETGHKGMGSFQFAPRDGEKYSVKIDKPADIKTQPELPAVNNTRQLALDTGAGVFEPGQPIALHLLSRKADVPLVVSAYCGGVQVGQQAVTTGEGAGREAGATDESLSIALPAEVSGVVRLTVYDYSAAPPQPVAERLVYRRPDRRLQVRVADHSERYSPGEPVQMSLVVTDEKGQPAPAALGVAVVDDALLKMADDDTPAMPTHFYLTTEVEKPEDLEKADFYLSDDTKAPAALDLLLGTQGWRRFVEKSIQDLPKDGKPDDQLARLVALGGAAPPPTMYDNLNSVQAQYNTQLADFRERQSETLSQLGRVALFGAVAILLFVLLSAVLRMTAGMKFWVPTLGAATACLVIGLVWMNEKSEKQLAQASAVYSDYGLVVDAPVAMNGPGTVEEWGAQVRGDFDDALHALVLKDNLHNPEQVKMLELQKWRFDANGDNPIDGWEKLGYFADVDALNDRGGFGLRRFAQVPFANGGIVHVDRKGQQAGRQKALNNLKQLDLAQAANEPQDLRQLAGLRGWLATGKHHWNEELLLDRAKKLGESLEKFRFTVREYAHQHTAGEPGVRSDFAETVFWHPLLIADANGRAEVKFDLSDSVTTYRVLVDAHDGAGRIGGGKGEVVSRIPFNIEPKMPLEVTAGDRIELPVAVTNDTRGELPVHLALTANELIQLGEFPHRDLKLAADARGREFFSLDVVGQSGQASLEVRGTAGRLADAKRQAITVVPPGFPVSQSYAGKLAGEKELKIRLPEDWVPGSLRVTMAAFPSSLADLQRGLESIIRDPGGCFEQASSSNYPNILVLAYMQEHNVADPELTRRAKGMLTSGYKLLTGYECPQKGYEWFGGDPGHEALSAYGLMEFRDMSQVFDVDPKMIDRTAAWLLARRNGNGGFQRNPRALDSFGGAPEEITNAYITWALTEAKQPGIDAEIKHVLAVAAKSDDPYLLALAGSVAINSGEKEIGKQLLEKLTKAQKDDGHVDAKETSITRSGGKSLTTETTALAALAWLKDPNFAVPANKAVQWITQNRDGGGFGSTQATILALKALVAHAQANKKTVAAGEFIVKRDGETIGQRAFSADEKNAITVAGIEAKLQPGENVLTLALTGGNEMPYAVDVGYRSRKPVSSDACPVRLTTKLAAEKVRAGDTVALNAQLTNMTEKGQPMTVAILGLPVGLQPRADQLEELKKAGTIDYYETRAREVVCYWRALAPSRQVDLKLDLVAEWPGQYTGPASRAYLYYTAEQKQWVDPLAVEIARQ